MSSTGTVSIKEIWVMLKKCAPGHVVVEKEHHYRVTYGALVFPALPLGQHGKRDNSQIQVGHVKKMARTLGILPCAKKVFGF